MAPSNMLAWVLNTTHCHAKAHKLPVHPAIPPPQVDPWCEGIWGPIKAALAGGAAPAPAHAPAAAAAAAPAPAAAKAPAAAAASAAAAAAAPVALIGGLAPAGVDLAGVPALAPPRVAVVTDVPAEVRGQGCAGASRQLHNA